MQTRNLSEAASRILLPTVNFSHLATIKKTALIPVLFFNELHHIIGCSFSNYYDTLGEIVCEEIWKNKNSKLSLNWLAIGLDIFLFLTCYFMSTLSKRCTLQRFKNKIFNLRLPKCNEFTMAHRNIKERECFFHTRNISIFWRLFCLLFYRSALQVDGSTLLRPNLPTISAQTIEGVPTRTSKRAGQPVSTIPRSYYVGRRLTKWPPKSHLTRPRKKISGAKSSS